MEPYSVSIDAVVHSPTQATPMTLPSPSIGSVDGAIPIDIAARPKARRRTFMGLALNKIPSSSSLLRTRSSTAAYRAGARGSLSCVSLSSSGSQYDCSYGSSYSSDISPAYSTAPTSAASTPAPESQLFDLNARVRVVDVEAPSFPTSIGLPADIRPSSPLALTVSKLSETEGCLYFSQSKAAPKSMAKRPLAHRHNFNFWVDLPPEIRINILALLTPKQIVRCSSVSRAWHAMCFDGQLWSSLDASAFYRDIPAPALISIITSAGPFMRDLNLRGCVQLKEHWGTRGDTAAGLTEACRNLTNFSLEGTEVPRMAIHTFLLQNSSLVHVNLSGLSGATNSAMKLLANHCPKVEHLNISWCKNIDAQGVAKVIEGCSSLKDLRAGEIIGLDDMGLAQRLFETNKLERLVLMNTDISDDALTRMMHGTDPEIDCLTDRPMVPPRSLKHLDLSNCRGISNAGISSLAHNCPHLEGLQLSKIPGITDTPLLDIFPTTPKLTHLDLEELDELTNASMQCLAASPCAPWLRHLSISYCEKVGDVGMMAVLRSCGRIEGLDMDNTRISDLVLTEAAAVVRERNRQALANGEAKQIAGQTIRTKPKVGMRVVAYDCTNVTWMGVREILSRNAEFLRAPPPDSGEMKMASAAVGGWPSEVIGLKCFYNYQPTIDEHMKRVLRGDWDAARRLERKWADWMMLNAEAGAGGAGGRRRRRRAREARMMHADEEDGAGGVGGVGRRRRARSGGSGCVVM